MQPLQVNIVGPGRLGRSAAFLLEQQGHKPLLIGRQDPIPAADITWLTVPDRAIAEAAARVPIGGVVLHASGATGIEPLRPHSPAGSLHPLMSFPGPDVAMPTEPVIPAAVAGDPDACTAAHRLAEALGFSPFNVPGDRALYHAAAVTAGNFATTLLLEASAMLSAAGVSPEQAPTLLAPLAIASIRNASQHGVDALTGPIARGDENIIDAHNRALEEMSKDTRELYQCLLSATRRLKP